MADARLSTPTNPTNRVTVAGVAATFTDLVPTTTKPAAGIIYDATGSVTSAFTPNPSLVTLTPHSSVNNATAVGMRINRWQSYTNANGTILWVPATVVDVTLAYSTTAGNIPSASLDGSTAYFFTTITSNNYGPTPTLFSPGTAAPASGLTAHLTVDPMGAQILTVQFKSSSTPTMGVLWVSI